MGKAVLYSEPLKHTALLLSSLRMCDVHYYYIISPGVYIENDLTHLLTCHLIGGGTQKAWPPPPSTTMGHHSTNELLYGFCGDYPLSLTMSANDRAGTILKWFLPLQSPRTCEREGKWWGGVKASSSLGWWALHLFLSLRFAPLTMNRKGHYTLSHFLKHVELPVDRHKNVPMQMSQIRSPNVTFIPSADLKITPTPPPTDMLAGNTAFSLILKKVSSSMTLIVRNGNPFKPFKMYETKQKN